MIKMRLLKGKKAQAMTEYILVISLLSLVFITSSKLFSGMLTSFAKRIIDIFFYPMP